MNENKIKVFENKNFGSVRTLTIDNEPYFVGKDVATNLGYVKSRNAIAKYVDNDDKKEAPIQGDLGGTQTMIIINESGLYSLIFGSKLPKAKEFKRWVTSEVLPALRKTGTYSIQTKRDSYLIDNPAERARRWAEEYEEKVALETKIENDKPLVQFATHIQTSDDCIDMKAMAKIAAKNGVKIGRTRLFKFLREHKVLDKNNQPYQKYIEAQPWFQVKEYTYAKGYEVCIGTITTVTPKGQIGIVNMLKKNISEIV